MDEGRRSQFTVLSQPVVTRSVKELDEEMMDEGCRSSVGLGYVQCFFSDKTNWENFVLKSKFDIVWPNSTNFRV
jgi:hypothetical protein